MMLETAWRGSGGDTEEETEGEEACFSSKSVAKKGSGMHGDGLPMGVLKITSPETRTQLFGGAVGILG